MDIHRSRFIAYPTSAISALAFSRSTDNGYTGPLPRLILAIGRANGDVEIWNPHKGLWVQETIFRGDGRSIDGLAWTQDPDEEDAEGKHIPGQLRLFSIASSPAVTEWDLAKGRPKRTSTGNFSEVWCLAVQPRWRPQRDGKEDVKESQLVAGCGDGTLVLLSTQDDDLQFSRVFARVSGKRARCMCVAYQNRERVVAGFADSMIRVYNSRKGSMLRSMSLGIGVPGAPKHALVWQIKCLPNGDIVSADSNGELRFWDGRTFSQTQRLDGHETDCLDLVVGSDGKTIFSGSIDGKIAIYRQSNNEQGRKTWAKSSHRRAHRGEVKAMTSFDSKGLSIVVSGGSDVAPLVTPLRAYGRENIRYLPGLPQQPPVVSAPKVRLVASWWASNVRIWSIAKRAQGDEMMKPQKRCNMVARISLATEQAITCVSISPDGRIVAAATDTEVKVFQLRKNAHSDALAVRKLDLPKDFADGGARMISISPDGKWLACVNAEGEIYVVRLVADSARPKHVRVIERVVELDRQPRKNTRRSSTKAYDRTINHLVFAPDSSVLAVSDLSGFVDCWVLKGHEDSTAAPLDVTKDDSNASTSDGASDSDSDWDSSADDDNDNDLVLFYGQHWSEDAASHLIPKLDSAPLVLTFRPSTKSAGTKNLTNGNPGVHATRHNPHAHSHELPRGQYRLWVMTARHEMYELDVLAGKLSEWSRRNSSAVLPHEFSMIRDRVRGALWDVTEQRERIWLYGSSFVCMLNVSDDSAPRSNAAASAPARRRKRKDGQDDDDDHKDFKRRRKLESGAGSRIGMHRVTDVVSDVAKRYDDGTWKELRLARRGDAQSEGYEDDDEESDVDFQLTPLRPAEDEPQATGAGPSGQRRWWCTFKYRPILGVVPLQDDDEADPERALEVVLVERPLESV